MNYYTLNNNKKDSKSLMRKQRYRRLKNKNKINSYINKIKLIKIIKTYVVMIIILILLYVFIGIQKEDNIKTLIYDSNKLDTSKLDVSINSLYVENDNTKNEETMNNSISNSELLGQYKGYNVIANLEIPKLDFKTQILEMYSEEALNISPTKYLGPSPNTIGNFVIIGHNYIQENMFSKLIDLEIGDIINLEDGIIGIKKYIVFDIYKVESNNLEPLLEEDKNIELTLITCVNYSSERLVIKAISN